MREIQVRYKQTILGVVWALVQPLLTTGIFAVLLGLLMGKGNEPGIKGVPYVVSTFCAMLPGNCSQTHSARPVQAWFRTSG